ncbi:hypothetical protein NQP46_20500 [Streptomyces albus]|nr:hypothetical protein NQP46_20500 [Streptomyces albus]
MAQAYAGQRLDLDVEQESRCAWAKVRTCCCTKRMSSRTVSGTPATMRSISAAERRKESGLQLSNFSEY